MHNRQAAEPTTQATLVLLSPLLPAQAVLAKLAVAHKIAAALLNSNDEAVLTELEGDDEDIDADTTVAEEMDYDDVQKALRKLQKARRRKNVNL